MSFRSTVLASAVLSLAVSSAAFADPKGKVSGKVTDHVVVISIDGLRPDAIEKFGAKTLMRLMRDGSYTLKAQTILPSKTLPSHTSMLTGVDADQHRITWNTDQTADRGQVDVPTIFGLAHLRGFYTSAFFSKTKFHHLEAPNSLDYVRSPKGGLLNDRWPAKYTAALVNKHLKSAETTPNLMFVHLGEPDYAGHLFGWMSFMYGRAVKEADEAVKLVLDQAEQRFGRGNFTVIVTADHGGNGKNHGSSNPLDTTIPWIVWGKGVQAGSALPAGIRTMDTAATALWMLGVSAPGEWVGRPVTGAFTQAAAVAANN